MKPKKQFRVSSFEFQAKTKIAAGILKLATGNWGYLATEQLWHVRTGVSARCGNENRREPPGARLLQGGQRYYAERRARAAHPMAGGDGAVLSRAGLCGCGRSGSRASPRTRRHRIGSQNAVGIRVCPAVRVLWREFVLAVEKEIVSRLKFQVSSFGLSRSGGSKLETRNFETASCDARHIRLLTRRSQ